MWTGWQGSNNPGGASYPPKQITFSKAPGALSSRPEARGSPHKNRGTVCNKKTVIQQRSMPAATRYSPSLSREERHPPPLLEQPDPTPCCRANHGALCRKHRPRQLDIAPVPASCQNIRATKAVTWSADLLFKAQMISVGDGRHSCASRAETPKKMGANRSPDLLVEFVAQKTTPSETPLDPVYTRPTTREPERIEQKGPLPPPLKNVQPNAPLSNQENEN